MGSNSDKLEQILEASDEIREILFGHGFEDFRTNRKLKIQITEKILSVIEAVENAGELLADFIPNEKYEEIRNIKTNLLLGTNGISEEFIWQLCKRDLLLLTKAIRTILRK